MLAIIAAITNEQEREAIEEIFQRHYPRMKQIAEGVLHNEQDAEDAVMNAVVYMCRHPEWFLDYQSTKTISLVFLCVKNAAIDLYRRNQCRRKHTVYADEENTFFEQIPDSDPLIVDIVISQENRDMVVRAIDRLEDMYRTPILLRYNYQMRNTEIAEFLHIEVNKVNGRLFRAKKQLEIILMEMGYTYE